MRSHFSAFLRILSNVNTRTCVIYAAYFRNATYMQHICRIYAAYFSAYFAKFRIFFPHILHQNGPHILRKISAINRYPYTMKKLRMKQAHLRQNKQRARWRVEVSAAAADGATVCYKAAQVLPRPKRHARRVIGLVDQRVTDLEVKCAHKPLGGRPKAGRRAGHAACGRRCAADQ